MYIFAHSSNTIFAVCGMPGGVMLKGRVMLKGGSTSASVQVNNMFTVVFPPFSITLKVYLPLTSHHLALQMFININDKKYVRVMSVGKRKEICQNAYLLLTKHRAITLKGFVI